MNTTFKPNDYFYNPNCHVIGQLTVEDIETINKIDGDLDYLIKIDMIDGKFFYNDEVIGYIETKPTFVVINQIEAADSNQYAMASDSNDLSASMDGNCNFTATWNGNNYLISNGSYKINGDECTINDFPGGIIGAYEDLLSQMT